MGSRQRSRTLISSLHAACISSARPAAAPRGCRGSFDAVTPGSASLNTVERAAVAESALLYDEIAATVDQRTHDILERRRRTAVVRRRGWLVRRMLLLADVVGLGLAFAIAQLIFASAPGASDRVGEMLEVMVFLATLPVWIVVAKLHGLYDHDEERTDHSTADDMVGVFHLVTIGAWIVFAVGALTSAVKPEVPKLIFFWGLAIALVTLGRAVARAFCRRRLTYLQNTVIVGAGDVGQLIARKLLQHPEYGINLVGFVDANPRELRNGLAHSALLGPPARLPAIVRMFDIERVIFAFSQEPHERTLDLIRSLKDLDVQVDIVPRFFEIVGPGVGMHTVEGLALVGLPPLRLSRSSRLLKRTVDFVVAGAGLFFLLPLFAVIGFLIKRESPGPVFFRQVRMGAHDKTFRIYKFRTMVADADDRKQELAHLNMHAQNGNDPRMFKIPDDPRLTHVGRFLRRYALDELPQLINVIKGEMSLVGPRPLILDEDQHVTEWARKRLDLKPGATGLWQVLGASDIPFDEMTNLDYLYVTNWSLWGDLRVIFRTVPAVFRARRAY
jgi:exopolysaccharide biosynthesis polyprenyl glycosylphosphotransferase